MRSVDEAAPRVSVIVTTYRAERFVEEAIASVQRQTTDDWELILADDGSPDKTTDVARRAIADDPRIRLLELSHSGLPAVVRNRACRLARGRVLAFMDGDDVWYPEKLEVQLREMDRHGRDWAFANCTLFGETKTGDEYDLFPAWWRPSRPFLPELLTGGQHVPILTLTARRATLLSCTPGSGLGGVFDENPRLRGATDYDLAIRLARTGEPAYSPESLAGYRQHASNLSRDREVELRPWGALLEKLEEQGDLPAELIEAARRTLDSKRALHLMRSGDDRWSRQLREALEGGRWDLRRVTLTALSVLPRRMAVRLFETGVRHVRRL